MTSLALAAYTPTYTASAVSRRVHLASHELARVMTDASLVPVLNALTSAHNGAGVIEAAMVNGLGVLTPGKARAALKELVVERAQDEPYFTFGELAARTDTVELERVANVPWLARTPGEEVVYQAAKAELEERAAAV